jgi:hypothetical protein
LDLSEHSYVPEYLKPLRKMLNLPQNRQLDSSGRTQLHKKFTRVKRQDLLHT